MTVTTLSIIGFTFPRDLPKVTPEVARNLMAAANKVHLASAALIAAPLFFAYLIIPSQTNLKVDKEEAQKEDNNLSLEVLEKHEKHEHTRCYLMYALVATSLMLSAFFALTTYRNMSDYYAVAYPRLKEIAMQG